MFTGSATVASGRVQLRRIASATATRIVVGGDVARAADCAEEVASLRLDEPLVYADRTQRGEGHHGFVGLDFHHVVVGLNLIADYRGNVDGGGLGDGLAGLRHDDRDL